MKAENQRRALAMIARGKYRADTRGRVLSLYDSHVRVRRTPLPLKAATLPKGYKTIVLCMDGRPLQLLVHQFVWLFFKGAIPKGYELNHKNACKADNRIHNLELVTGLQNARHAVSLGLVSSGSMHYLAKLTRAKVQRIREAVTAGAVQKHLAKQYGVSTGTIRDVVHRKTWKDM